MKYILVSLVLIASFSLLFSGPVLVQATVPIQPNQGSGVSPSQDTSTKLEDPLGNRELPEIIGGGIKIGLGVVGAIALALFVYGGFMWMTAAGNTQRVQKGREVLVWATIGLIVIFTSYAILNFILGAITGTA